ncbi:CotH kinase family protein [Cryomorphaceae bacterium 1068]|nr:CotH kinase family protein [Cryomorphaceae bacterium 1068]
MKPLLLKSIIIVMFFCVSCAENTTNDTKDSYRIECNSDEEEQVNTGFNGRIATTLGGEKTDKEFHSAPTSLRIDKENSFAFTTRIENAETDQYFKVSIWRKDPNKTSKLVIDGEPKGIIYLEKPIVVEKGENGWEKLEIEFELPPAVEAISIYARAPSNEGYFDDLVIESFRRKEYPEFRGQSGLHLYFSEEELAFFESEREEAFREGVHFSRDRWSKGVLSDEKIVIPIEARLKGDWLDHMQGRKWSFRVKTREDRTFGRMRSFSVQTPASRNFLHEYLAHELFTDQGILTTRYSFTPLYLNTENFGLYAIEEHFAKQLIEFNLRREGPIIRFDEDPFWRVNALTVGTDRVEYPYMPVFETSRITPFGTNKVLSDTIMYGQFLIAQSLLNQFRNRESSIDDLFDLDKLAKYLALMDLVDGKHGFIWHNMRFYYNPVLCKLEPINFDNYTEEYEDGSATLSALVFDKNSTYLKYENMIHSFFGSEKLLELYLNYLEEYTDPEFIQEFLVQRDDELNEHADLINMEFSHYNLPEDFLQSNALDLKAQIAKLREKRTNGYFTDIEFKEPTYPFNTALTKSLVPYFVNLYYSKANANEASLLVENYNARPVQFMAILNEQKRELYSFDDLILDNYSGQLVDTMLSMPYFTTAKYAVLKALDSDEEYTAELSLWKKNTLKSPYQKLKSDSSSNPNQLFIENGDSLILKKGDYVLRNKILIPEGKVVLFEAGVHLNMIDSACIVSHSRIIANGTGQERILIQSSDSSANGFNVLQAHGESYVSHTTFSNLSTLSYKGWGLTGAVNFYESDVTFSHTTFEDNHCEDALNIIRSTFLVDSSFFYGIYSDAFDSDFCTGQLLNSTFDKIGNDAIDFSTSQIDIANCYILNANDKGISGGEQSTLNVTNCTVENCNIGVASKDLSQVNLKDVEIINSNYGLVALQKKPEYGGATLRTKGLSIKNCETKFLIERGSSVYLEERKIEGTAKDVYEIFY